MPGGAVTSLNVSSLPPLPPSTPAERNCVIMQNSFSHSNRSHCLCKRPAPQRGWKQLRHYTSHKTSTPSTGCPRAPTERALSCSLHGVAWVGGGVGEGNRNVWSHFHHVNTINALTGTALGVNTQTNKHPCADTLLFGLQGPQYFRAVDNRPVWRISY